MLYEVEDEGIALSTEVAQYVVGTLQLSELLNFLPLHTDPTKGSVVITSASRVDILLGLIQLHESKSPSSLAAVVLTGGRPPPKEVDALVKGGASKGTLPILSSPLPTFETAAALANVEGYITAKAPRKIERAQMLFDDHIDINMIKRAILQVNRNFKLSRCRNPVGESHMQEAGTHLTYLFIVISSKIS
jgi:phosphate acetyltransferase